MKKYLIFLIVLTAANTLMAQLTDTLKKQKKAGAMDALLDSVSADNKVDNVVIFKATRMILSQSTEMTKKKNLNFLIIHRFGDICRLLYFSLKGCFREFVTLHIIGVKMFLHQLFWKHKGFDIYAENQFAGSRVVNGYP